MQNIPEMQISTISETGYFQPLRGEATRLYAVHEKVRILRVALVGRRHAGLFPRWLAPKVRFI
jgi:hypothetical protein